MKAVCFRCGTAKNDPLVKCPGCGKKPASRNAKVASLALSDQCLKPHHLEKATAYITKTKKLPKFHASILRSAKQALESHLNVLDVEDDDSIDMSDSFFQMTDNSVEDEATKFVTVHAIGKPPEVDMSHRGTGTPKPTYHKLQWEIGKEIDADMVATNQDSAGEICVWFRWLENSWSWKCVHRTEFEQIRSVEQ